MATTTQHVDEGLKEELAEMVGATQGDVVYGEVREVKKVKGGHYGDTIKVKVWIPTDEIVTHTFKQPKPPFDQWKFTRFARAYGHGLVDLDGLLGSEVPVKYNGAWSVVIPDKPEPEKSFFMRIVGWYRTKRGNIVSDPHLDNWTFLFFLSFSPLFFGFILFDAFEGDTEAKWCVWGFVSTVLWIVLPMLFLLL